MTKNRLHIVAIGEKAPKPAKTSRREEAQAKFERLWLVDPQQFNPNRNCREQERLNRTWSLLTEHFDPKGKHVVDLGSGQGVLSLRLCDAGARVHAVDIASNALKHLKDIEGVETFQNYVPTTTLADEAYDLVLCTDLIAYLHANEYRILFAELSRLVKPDGYVLCSTPFDLYTEDPLQRFGSLAETEFKPIKWVFSYHFLHIKLSNFFNAPSRLARAWRDKEYRRTVPSKWFHWNSSPLLGWVWFGVQHLMLPFHLLMKKSKGLLLALEKVSRFLWSDAGISHAMFIGKRRPLFEKPPEDELPKEIKHKKQVWE